MTRRLCAVSLPVLAVLLTGLSEASRDDAIEKGGALEGLSKKAISHHSHLDTAASAGTSASGSQASLAVGTKSTLKKTAKEAARPYEEDGEDDDHQDEHEPVLCHVADQAEPTQALEEIEKCVKQLEIIKEGTLDQGKVSMQHNSNYVKALSVLENRMTELSQPEPFEIAFAVDQNTMYNSLKDRLTKLQANLPVLTKGPGELPGI